MSGILTYIYIYWNNESKHKKNPKSKKKSVNLITPCAVALIMWFISSNYLDNNETPQILKGGGLLEIPKNLKDDILDNNKINLLNEKMVNVEAINTEGINTEGVNTESYHLIGKNNIRLPQTDVFIDLFDL